MLQNFTPSYNFEHGSFDIELILGSLVAPWTTDLQNGQSLQFWQGEGAG